MKITNSLGNILRERGYTANAVAMALGGQCTQVLRVIIPRPSLNIAWLTRLCDFLKLTSLSEALELSEDGLTSEQRKIALILKYTLELRGYSVLRQSETTWTVTKGDQSSWFRLNSQHFLSDDTEITEILQRIH